MQQTTCTKREDEPPMTTTTTTTSARPKGKEKEKVKLSRLRGSCDQCRRKKIACDSAKLPGKVCTHCQRFKLECTHEFFLAPKKSQRQKDYIANLEMRNEKLQNYIRKMHPGEDLDQIIGLAPSSQDASTSSFLLPPSRQTSESVSDAVSSPSQDIESQLSDNEDLAHVALTEHLSHLSVHMVEDRYFGQSSAFMLAKQVSSLRREIAGTTGIPEDLDAHKRLLFWDLKPWELSFCTTAETSFVYPEDDLLMNLVSLYFDTTNCLIPILHQPTFMNTLSVGQHHWDPSFGATVLMACALGSRYSEDPRVFLPNDESGLSAGWKYYSQIPLYQRSMIFQSTTYDLQYYALSSLFLVGTSMPQLAFTMVAIGLHMAWERGVHRRRRPDQKPSVDSELQRRAFWALMSIDRFASAMVGRPGGFSDESSDAEYPIECDDEFWEPEDPQKAFQQPPGKPCTVTAYVQFIKLCEILGVALRTLYANKKSRLLSGYIGEEWERTTVAHLDSSLNKWKDSLPDYLHWNPNGQDPVFFKQAVNLHTFFSYVQIQIHRPFLFKKSSLSFASLAISTNAARFCIHILETAISRRSLCILPSTLTTVFTAGTVIVLGLWGARGSGFKADSLKELEMVQRCLEILHFCEKRWNWAGRLADVLNQTVSVQDYHRLAGKNPSIEQYILQTPTAPTFSNPLVSDPPRINYPQPIFSFSDPPPFLPGNDIQLGDLLPTQHGTVYDRRGEDGIVFDTPTRETQGVPSTQYATSSTTPMFDFFVSEVPSPQETSMFWSDFSNAFNSSEKWETYLANMVQSRDAPG